MLEEIVDLAKRLIAVPSVTGQEAEALKFLSKFLAEQKWNVELLNVPGGGDNLFVSHGVPKVIFSTHIDVVPAPEKLFTPRIDGGRLTGRGACDAKGIIAVMVYVINELRRLGERDFGLLILVAEETDSKGAKSAATLLGRRGIEAIINGEPTEGKVVTAHKGSLGVRVRFSGRSCHSGYPELGEDANAKLLRFACSALDMDFGSDAELGRATVNVGVIHGGNAANTVSGAAECAIMVRTVGPNDEVLPKLQELAADASSFEIVSNSPSVRMLAIPGIESAPAAYGTDIPHLLPLTEKCVLYGPGTIHLAHTDNESVALSELSDAFDGYQKIYRYLKTLP